MKIRTELHNSAHKHEAVLETNNIQQSLSLSTKSSGFGSSLNGAELLLLSLATCFCNDIYREAKKRNLTITAVHVQVEAEFGAEGEPGKNFTYKTEIESSSAKEEIEELIKYTDSVAEIHNTLRQGMPITLVKE